MLRTRWITAAAAAATTAAATTHCRCTAAVVAAVCHWIALLLPCLLPRAALLECSTFKKRAPRALQAIRDFARKTMGTEDVRIDTLLNKFLWSQGIRNVPHRVRVRLHRKRNEDEESSEKLYTHVTHVNVPTFKGLKTVTVKDE
jgi:large subunit ribosomal protein L31e